MDPPDDFLCPITLELFREPVIAADNNTYERSAILRWFRDGNRSSPITNQNLKNTQIQPNIALLGSINSFLQKNEAIREQLQRLDKMKKHVHAQPSAALRVREFIDPISYNFMRDPVSFANTYVYQ